KIECEYADASYVVLMISPYNSQNDFQRLAKAMEIIPQKEPVYYEENKVIKAVKKMTIRQAYFSAFHNISVEQAAGKICARSAISCQPSIPIIAPGELVTGEIVKILKKYGILNINVL
ncbi:MAG: arginine decarboxylase, partial [Oscillospiraceae bacterium]